MIAIGTSWGSVGRNVNASPCFLIDILIFGQRYSFGTRDVKIQRSGTDTTKLHFKGAMISDLKWTESYDIYEMRSNTNSYAIELFSSAFPYETLRKQVVLQNLFVDVYWFVDGMGMNLEQAQHLAHGRMKDIRYDENKKTISFKVDDERLLSTFQYPPHVLSEESMGTLEGESRTTDYGKPYPIVIGSALHAPGLQLSKTWQPPGSRSFSNVFLTPSATEGAANGERGVRFKSLVSGRLISARVYIHEDDNAGTFTASLWAEDEAGTGGVLIEKKDFETINYGGDWSTVEFDAPIPIVADRYYRLSVNAFGRVYRTVAPNPGSFATAQTNETLSGVSGCTGAFGEFPATLNTNNYWRDVVVEGDGYLEADFLVADLSSGGDVSVTDVYKGDSEKREAATNPYYTSPYTITETSEVDDLGVPYKNVNIINTSDEDGDTSDYNFNLVGNNAALGDAVRSVISFSHDYYARNYTDTNKYLDMKSVNLLDELPIEVGMLINSNVSSGVYDILFRRLGQEIPFAVVPQGDKFAFKLFDWDLPSKKHLQTNINIIERLRGPQETDMENVYNQFVFTYAISAFQGENTKVLCYNPSNNMLCKKSAYKYGGRAMDVIELGDISNLAGAKWVADWFVELFTKLRISMVYKCSLDVINVDLFDTVLVTDEYEGFTNVPFKVIGIERTSEPSIDLCLLSVDDITWVYPYLQT